MVTKGDIFKSAATIEKYTSKFIAEGQDATEAQVNSKKLVNTIIDDSIALNQKIEAATKAQTTTTINNP